MLSGDDGIGLTSLKDVLNEGELFKFRSLINTELVDDVTDGIDLLKLISFSKVELIVSFMKEPWRTIWLE